MESSTTGDLTDVIVVGAGLTGLACADALCRAGLRVLLLESGKRVGGVVDTMDVGGFLFESGPNTVPAGAAHVRRAADRLGIASQIVTSRPEAKRRYLFKNGGLHELPSSLRALMSTELLSRAAKRRIASEVLRRAQLPDRSESEPTLEDFLSERIGVEATRTVAGAFVRGVYAAEIDELGARSAFPRMWNLVAEHGGLVRGMMARGKAAKRARRAGEPPLPGPATSATDLLSFTGGFGVLTDAYARSLQGSVSTSTAVVEIDRGPGGWRAVLESGEALSCRELVLAVPARAAHPLVALCAPERLDIDALRDVRHAAVTAVHMGLEDAPLPPGFGFLVPPDEEAKGDPRTPRALGMLFISNLFNGRAPSGTTSVTAMMRGGDVADLVGDQLVDRASVELNKALQGFRVTEPTAPTPKGHPRVVASRIQRWTDVIPRYSTGHGERMATLTEKVERMLPGLHLAGNYVGGVSVDDRIRYGGEIAARVTSRLAHLKELRGQGSPGAKDPSPDGDKDATEEAS